MPLLLRATVNGLAGRSEPIEINLNRRRTVFFGPNGSGKTSLLRLLHAVLEHDFRPLHSIAFTSAVVDIYSINHDREYQYVISRKASTDFNAAGLRRDRTQDAEAILPEDATTQYDRIRRAHKQVTRIRCRVTPEIKPTVNRWRHEFLSTDRLRSLSDSRASHARTTQSEFEQRIQQLWLRFFSDMSWQVRTLQEKSLSTIFAHVFSAPTKPLPLSAEITNADRLYNAIQNFIRRQRHAYELPVRDEFIGQLKQNAMLFSVADELADIEERITHILRPRTALESLLNSVFLDNKKIRLTEDEIQAIALDGSEFSLDSLSSGEKHLFLLLLEAYQVGNSPLLLDEPEISLHVDWQRRLFDFIESLNPEAQIIAATHSPEILAGVEDAAIFELPGFKCHRNE